MNANIVIGILTVVIILLIADNLHHRWVNNHLRDIIKDLKKDYEMLRQSKLNNN